MVISVGGFEAGKIGGNFNLSVSNGFMVFKIQVLLGFKKGGWPLCNPGCDVLLVRCKKGQNKGSKSKSRARITSRSS